MQKYAQINPAIKGDISDLYGGGSNNELVLLYGHESKYWNFEYEYWNKKRLGNEGFAEMFAATVEGGKHREAFERWLPKSYNLFLDILNEISYY